jgi:RNA polymerase sigma-70 factor, ECF subfamily
MLRARKSRRTDYVGTWLPEPVVDDPGTRPEDQAVLADSIGLALLVVLETLTPSERLAFVLHDVFALRFEEIAPIMGRTPGVGLQRRVVDASRGRANRRLRGAARRAGPRRRAAVRPRGPARRCRPAAAVRRTRGGPSRRADGAALCQVRQPGPGQWHGRCALRHARAPLAVLGLTVVDGRIAALDLIADRAKLHRLSLQP